MQSPRQIQELANLNRFFVYLPEVGFLRDRWRILRGQGVLKGDCDDYALTLLWRLSGRSRLRMFKALLTREAGLYFCKTQKGYGHLTLKYRGMWICNIYPFWIKRSPHDVKFRAPLPLVLAKMVGSRLSAVLLLSAAALLITKTISG